MIIIPTVVCLLLGFLSIRSAFRWLKEQQRPPDEKKGSGPEQVFSSPTEKGLFHIASVIAPGGSTSMGPFEGLIFLLIGAGLLYYGFKGIVQIFESFS